MTGWCTGCGAHDVTLLDEGNGSGHCLTCDRLYAEVAACRIDASLELIRAVVEEAVTGLHALHPADVQKAVAEVCAEFGDASSDTLESLAARMHRNQGMLIHQRDHGLVGDEIARLEGQFRDEEAQP